MKQLNKEQAEKVFTSAVWDLWSDAQIVQFQLFQDRLCVPWDVFHKAIENELGRLPKELREVHIRNNALQGAHQNLSTFQLYTLSLAKWNGIRRSVERGSYYYYKSLGFNISRYVRLQYKSLCKERPNETVWQEHILSKIREIEKGEPNE